jgi:deoxyadenosine/deoxycytidine kinase
MTDTHTPDPLDSPSLRRLSNPSVYITIAGLIGVGKSTLAEKIAEKLNYTLIKEPIPSEEDKTLLQAFYENMEKYAFTLQIHLGMLRGRQNALIKAAKNNPRVRGIIQDRSPWEDNAFVLTLHKYGMIDKIQKNVYETFFNTFIMTYEKPSCIIYLKASPKTCLERINMRGRAMEKNISLEYLQTLEQSYEELMKKLANSGVAVIEIDWEVFQNMDTAVDIITKRIKERNKIIPIDGEAFKKPIEKI